MYPGPDSVLHGLSIVCLVESKNWRVRGTHSLLTTHLSIKPTEGENQKRTPKTPKAETTCSCLCFSGPRGKESNHSLLVQLKQDPYRLGPLRSEPPLHQIEGPEMPGRLEKTYYAQIYISSATETKNMSKNPECNAGETRQGHLPFLSL